MALILSKVASCTVEKLVGIMLRSLIFHHAFTYQSCILLFVLHLVVTNRQKGKKIKEERDDHEVSEGIRVDISVERGQRDSGLVEVSPGKQRSFHDNGEDVDILDCAFASSKRSPSGVLEVGHAVQNVNPCIYRRV
ncbi:hypothetical protein EUGRSUZ_C00529 [Eucalyptus grandis]|uniref:Uncharacterized protein n=2 Tax=Eucalyptus grandis TaxID=71139 RepID=A0ACC3LB69_EUCGR|nr:hypothetical protein EUGRSUZ_C00529 [Eucalyptus grandis]